LSTLARLAIRLIENYQAAGGGLSRYGVDCNFLPSCSEYTKQCIGKFGFIAGVRLGLHRISRCNDPDCIHKRDDPPPEFKITMSMLKKQQVEAEEESIRLATAQLTDEQRLVYLRTIKSQIKDPDTYATLNYSLCLGLHHFYLKQYARGVSELILALVAIAMVIEGSVWVLGILILLGLSVSEVMHLFRSEIIVQDYNNRIMRQALLKIAGSIELRG
jgi:putative component of membrane protein insertase Oxa1/YidC/SpoIIIJ protein YidD